VKAVRKIIKDTTGKTQSCDTITKINSEAGQLTDTKETVTAVNHFFVQYTGNLNDIHINVHKALQFLKEAYPNKTVEMNAIPVTKIEMINTIKSLNNKNSSGYDRISNKILKCCANEVSKPFTFICSSSIASGIFPERFKFAIVRPIHKKGDRMEMTNYRPISLLISVSKIIETLMFNRLNQYLHANEILASELFGFRKGNKIKKPFLL
jgi:hypothetical protein